MHIFKLYKERHIFVLWTAHKGIKSVNYCCYPSPMAAVKQPSIFEAHSKSSEASGKENASLPALRDASVDVLCIVLRHMDICSPSNIPTWTLLHATSRYWRALQKTLRKQMGLGQVPIRLEQILIAGKAYCRRMLLGNASDCVRANALLSILFRDAGWFTEQLAYSLPGTIVHDMSPEYPHHPDTPYAPFSVKLLLELLDSEDPDVRKVPHLRFNELWGCMQQLDRERFTKSFWRWIGNFERDALRRQHNLYSMAKLAMQVILSAFGSLEDSAAAIIILKLCVANTRRCWKPDCHRKYFRLRDMNAAFFRNVGCFEECRDLLKAVGWVEGNNCLKFNGTKDKSGAIKDNVSAVLRSIRQVLNDL